MPEHPNGPGESGGDETVDTLIDRIDATDARIGVIGLGYVGLPIALAFTDAGFSVRGFDIDSERVACLQAGDSYVDDITDAELVDGLARDFSVGATPETVADCDAYVLAVPTGASEGSPVMDAVEAATHTVGEQAGNGHTLVVVSSTVYPGATEEVVAPILEEYRPPDRTHLAMVPERLNPGGDHEASEIPLVVGAAADPTREAASELFDTIVVDTVPVDSTTTAEFTKTLENTYRMVNIALVNELAQLGEALDADVWDAIDAADTKPFGFQAFSPGPGVGGHCIPVDPQFLVWQGRNLDEPMHLVEEAQHVNESMPIHVLDRIQTALAARGVDLEDARLAVLGLAYKPDVGDVRNSPAVTIFQQLQERGATTYPVDPHVERVTVGATDMTPADTVDDVDLREVDAAILLVDHSAFDYEHLDVIPMVMDARDALPEDFDTTVVTLGKGLPVLEESATHSASQRK